MKSIRGAVGPEIPIRIDANQGWKKDSAIHILNEIASLNIQHCEEPVSRHLYMQLPEIRKRSPIKIMADESCCIPVDAERLIELGACDMFNIKKVYAATVNVVRSEPFMARQVKHVYQ